MEGCEGRRWAIGDKVYNNELKKMRKKVDRDRENKEERVKSKEKKSK